MSVVRPLPRRTTLALGVAGLAALAGCAERERTPARRSTEDPDSALVDSVIVEQAAAWRLASAAGLPRLAAMHAAHVEALDGVVTIPTPGRPADADAVRRREERLRRTLVDAAMAAESGELARLFASMSAAVAQQVAVL